MANVEDTINRGGDEHPDPSEGLTALDFYTAAADTLLARGEFGPDQHYYSHAIEIVAKDGTTSKGSYLLGDYFVHDSEPFESDGTEERYIQEAKKALAKKTSILSLRLLHADGRYVENERYVIFWPYKIKPKSWFDAIVNPPLRYRSVRTPWIPEGYPTDQILIINGQQQVVYHPGRNPNLRNIFATFSQPKR